jgi:hypothetical protein
MGYFRVLDMSRVLLNYVPSNPIVDVVLMGMREPQFVDLNNEILDDVGARTDPAKLCKGGWYE